MYNKKSKISAILVLVTAALLIGFMILLPNLQYKQTDDDNIGTAFGLIFLIVYGYPVVYAGSIPFAIVALVFGIKMLIQKDRKKLISYNVRMLITSIILLPFIAVGMYMASTMVFNSTLGALPIVYVIVMALSYVAGLVMQIVSIVLLKKAPVEEPAAQEERFDGEENV